METQQLGRRRFLRNAGLTLLVGAGLSSAQSAYADDKRPHRRPRSVEFHCCADNTGQHGCKVCSGNNTNYWCTSGDCPNGFCYGCTTFKGGCFYTFVGSC